MAKSQQNPLFMDLALEVRLKTHFNTMHTQTGTSWGHCEDLTGQGKQHA